jgi:phage terminase Nu1 subunit (DNA packaging protein)
VITENSTASAEVLNSWKEIAQYVNRGVRTVQRWEAELHLPVRRPRGKGRSAVIAMRSEIDLWLKACPLEKLEDSADRTISPLCRQTRNLVAESQQLRNNVSQSRLMVADAINRLIANLGHMIPPPPPGIGLTRCSTLPSASQSGNKSSAA